MKKTRDTGIILFCIQSAWNMPTHEQREQEERSLLNIRDAFKKIIITNSVMMPYCDDNGVLIIGLKDFLLDPKSLEF